MIILVLQLF